MKYNLSMRTDQERFKRRCNELYKAGKVVELTSTEKRSLNQNKYLHLILTWFAMETGYSMNFVKVEYFKKLCNPDIFCTERVCKFTGQILTDPKSSADCTTSELTTAIERFRNWSQEAAGIYLPEPNEQDFLQQIEIEASRNNFQ
jgi:hypothetical protein